MENVVAFDDVPSTGVCRINEYDNKVITKIVIGPLDDHTYYARSGFTQLGLWRKLYVHCIASQPANVFVVYVLY